LRGREQQHYAAAERRYASWYFDSTGDSERYDGRVAKQWSVEANACRKLTEPAKTDLYKQAAGELPAALSYLGKAALSCTLLQS
jgi:hypothetical protein